MARRISYEREKHHENQRLQAQKVEAIGPLAGGVANDLNNMLNIIISHSELALDAIKPSEPHYTSLIEIKKAGERSAELIQHLLALARKQTLAPKKLDLNKTMDQMLKMLQRLIGEDIELRWIPGKALWPVKLDPSQVDQILTNLCINARDAIVGAGKITIETDNTVLDESYCCDQAGFMPGEYVKLIVSDNGQGMNAETLGNIFEPYFTTKSNGEGMGLGLSTVYGIVKQNNGFINVYSEPGKGTAIKVYLQKAGPPKTDSAEKGMNQTAEGGNETIMVADDDLTILQMTKMILEKLGYTVILALSPGEAIMIAQEYDGDIDLLLTDVVMPDMNGPDLVKSILSLRPNIKHLFMSGYTASAISHHGVLKEGVYFIHKPFSMKELGDKIREVAEADKK